MKSIDTWFAGSSLKVKRAPVEAKKIENSKILINS